MYMKINSRKSSLDRIPVSLRNWIRVLIVFTAIYCSLLLFYSAQLDHIEHSINDLGKKEFALESLETEQKQQVRGDILFAFIFLSQLRTCDYMKNKLLILKYKN